MHLKTSSSHHTDPLRVNQVKIEFTSKEITSLGGLSIIARFLEEIGFKEWVEESFPVEETSPNGKGKYPKVLSLFLTALSGGNRFTHLLMWGYGREAIKKVFGEEWLPRAVSTLTRFFGKIKSQRQAELWREKAKLFVLKFLEWEGIEEDEVGFDSSVKTLYGEQEGAKKGYNPRKPGRPSHHPLFCFLRESCYGIDIWNRSGDTHSGQGIVEFGRESLSMLESRIRVRRVVCDTGFYRSDWVRALEEGGYRYIIGVPHYWVLQEKVMEIKDWREVEKGIEVGEFRFQHKAEGWDKERRYVAVRRDKRRHPKSGGKQLSLFPEFEEWEGWRVSVYVTNEDSPAEEIWRRYRPRAEQENRIKEIKHDFGLDGFNLDGFWATESVMVLLVLVCYTIINFLRRRVFCRHGKKERLRTLRMKWFIIPGQLGRRGRDEILRLAVRSRKVREKLRWMFREIGRLREKPNCNAFGFG